MKTGYKMSQQKKNLLVLFGYEKYRKLMEKLSLKTSSIYRTNQDIETALAWNMVKKTLQEA
jgi:hypothetical protein